MLPPDAELNGPVVALLEEGDPVGGRDPGLRNQRLAKGVMASDKELVAPVEPLQDVALRHEVELASRTTIAAWARQHEVPHAVEVSPQLAAKHPGEEVVHV